MATDTVIKEDGPTPSENTGADPIKDSNPTEESLSDTTGTPDPKEAPKEDPKEPEVEPTPPKEDEEEKEAPVEDSPKLADLGYPSYEDESLKQVSNIMAEKGVNYADTQAMFAEAVESGDISKVNKEELESKLGKDKAAQVILLAENYYSKQLQAMQPLYDAAYDVTGGKENYDAMGAWAKAKAEADPEFSKEMDQIRAMINTKQPKAVTAAVKDLFTSYTNDPSVTVPATLTTGDSKSKTYLEPLSRLEYGRLVNQATRDGTYNKVNKTLLARRKAGQAAGI